MQSFSVYREKCVEQNLQNDYTYRYINQQKCGIQNYQDLELKQISEIKLDGWDASVIFDSILNVI